MAMIKYCDECVKETVHSEGLCIQCATKRIKETKELFLYERSLLSDELRLTKIESDLFDIISKLDKIKTPIIFG